METHNHSKVGPLRRIIGFLFFAAAVAAVLGAVASLRAVNQPSSPEQAAALRKIAPWVTEHTAGGKQAEFMIILANQADLSGAAALSTKSEKGRFVHGDGTFDSPLTTNLQGALELMPGDLNRDGKLDLVVGGDGVQLLLGNGDGTFGLPATVYSNFDFGSLTVEDIDLDGRPDIMVSFSQTTLVGLRGQGDGTFRPPMEFLTGVFPTVGRVILKDLNGDGAPEAIVGGITDPLTVLINSSRRSR